MAACWVLSVYQAAVRAAVGVEAGRESDLQSHWELTATGRKEAVKKRRFFFRFQDESAAVN